MISDEVLSCMESVKSSLIEYKAALLKAIRGAIHSNCEHLGLLVTILWDFKETADVGSAIFYEYGELYSIDAIAIFIY